MHTLSNLSVARLSEVGTHSVARSPRARIAFYGAWPSVTQSPSHHCRTKRAKGLRAPFATPHYFLLIAFRLVNSTPGLGQIRLGFVTKLRFVCRPNFSVNFLSTAQMRRTLLITLLSFSQFWHWRGRRLSTRSVSKFLG